LQAGGIQFAEGELVGRFRPKQFWNKQGQMHDKGLSDFR
jgi:hypothetical protein